MSQDIQAVIQYEWSKISSQEQRSLIFDYIHRGGKKQQGSWMEFLFQHFQSHGEAQVSPPSRLEAPTQASA